MQRSAWGLRGHGYGLGYYWTVTKVDGYRSGIGGRKDCNAARGLCRLSAVSIPFSLSEPGGYTRGLGPGNRGGDYDAATFENQDYI